MSKRSTSLGLKCIASGAVDDGDDALWTGLGGDMSASYTQHRRPIIQRRRRRQTSPHDECLLVFFEGKIGSESRLLCSSNSIQTPLQHTSRHRATARFVKTTASTKPEVHNTSQRCQRRPIRGRTQHALKNGEVRSIGFRVMQADEQKKNRHTDHNSSHPSRDEVTKQWCIAHFALAYLARLNGVI